MVAHDNNKKNTHPKGENGQTGGAHPSYSPLLEVENFSVHFPQYAQGTEQVETSAIHRLDLNIYPGEIVAVVGASGSGKSLLADAILGILPSHAKLGGELRYKGGPLTPKRQEILRGKEIALIPQSVNALDPLMKVGKQVQTAIHLEETDFVKRKARKMYQQSLQEQSFAQMGLKSGLRHNYPFQLSGGMNRRVLVATAMVGDANLIIADEPTPGLDPVALNDTISSLRQIVTGDKAMMFITHDIEVALKIANRIVVFHEGETVETLTQASISNPMQHFQHPYTTALFQARPSTSFEATSKWKSTITSSRSVAENDRSSCLHVKNVAYHYPNQSALFSQVNLTISPGEIVGLFGKSGVGKSTLGQIMAGYMSPSTGSIRIGDHPIETYKCHPVQLIWQHPEKAINPRWRLSRVLQEAGGIDHDILKLLEINPTWLDRYPSELSGGELQRFAIARVIASDAPYIIADEITTMLDAVTQANIWKLILALAKEQKIGILAISHDDALLQRISDRIEAFDALGLKK